MKEPYLSVVVTSRNDDHGGDLLKRMQIFVSGFLEQARRFQLDSELIIVEWNPPQHRPRLEEALVWPAEAGPCRVRIIEVSAAIHQRYRHSDKLPLFQMIAKNAGIRRARGQFVLATNIDLLFSDDLMRFFSSGRLDSRAMYRIDRYDVPASVPVNVSVREQLEYCSRNVIRINLKAGTFAIGELPRKYGFAQMLANILASIPTRILRACLYVRTWLPHKTQARYFFDPAAIRSFCENRLRRCLTIARSFEQARSDLYKKRRKRPHALHTNACGDFTLLSSQMWSRLRGHPELEIFSIHLDSVLCQMAHYAGAKECILKGRHKLYHIEHGSGWSPEHAEALVKRMGDLGVPLLSPEQYAEWTEQMSRDKRPMIFNGTAWGLVRESLAETEPLARPAHV